MYDVLMVVQRCFGLFWVGCTVDTSDEDRSTVSNFLRRGDDRWSRSGRPDERIQVGHGHWIFTAQVQLLATPHDEERIVIFSILAANLQYRLI